MITPQDRCKQQLTQATKTIKDQAEEIGALKLTINEGKEINRELSKQIKDLESKLSEAEQKYMDAEITSLQHAKSYTEIEEKYDALKNGYRGLEELNGDYFIKIKALEKAIINNFKKQNL